MIKEYIAYLKDNPKGYWFKARLYGWGWAPAKKEGWIVLFVYLLVIIVPGLFAEKFIESGEEFLQWFLPLIVVATALLIWICYKKGEKPRWMWGPPDKYKTNHQDMGMGKYKFINFAVFIIFFGTALFEAFQKQKWIEATLFLTLGILSLWADAKRK